LNEKTGFRFANRNAVFLNMEPTKIIHNLKAMSNDTSDDVIIAGNVVLDTEKVNPAFPAMLKGSRNMIRFIGTKGFRKILEKTSWKLDRIVEENPTYAVFTLKKNKTA
jgi:hypothetical protein